MNNQKLFLIIAIGLTIFLLWDKWQIKQNPQQPITTESTDFNDRNVIESEQTKLTNKQQDIPTIVNDAKPINIPSVINDETMVNVETDLLEVSIDNNSTISRVILKKYPKTIDGKEKVALLNNSADQFFIASGGLAPQGVLPTHLDKWQVEKQTYILDGEQLIVPLVWQKNAIKVIKNFIFTRDSYLIKVNYQITNNSADDISVLHYSRLIRKFIDEYSITMPTFSGGAIYNDEGVYDKFDFDEFSDRETVKTKGGFAAQVQHYFIGAIIPEQQQVNQFRSKVNSFADDLNNHYILENVSPVESIKSGTTKTIEADSFYIGPKEQERINTVVDGLDYTVDYSWLYILAKPLSTFIYWINSLVQNWGLTIIILTIIVKLVFYKLSEKSYKSMAGMRKLAPRLEQLKAKYGDDRVAMGKKTMDLYKEAKVNPASGCLPILVQMPVFIALYWVLIEMVELRHTPFLYLSDLSSADPYYILPVLMGITMFVQQKLNPKPTDPVQAKIMMSLPIVFTVFFLWFPSGLVLYWLANNILSILQQWVITKRMENISPT